MIIIGENNGHSHHMCYLSGETEMKDREKMQNTGRTGQDQDRAGQNKGRTGQDQSRRVSRTLKKIRETYLDLARQKDPSKITVSELAAGAGINRKTFYMYYSGTDELLEEIANDLLERYRELISGVELYSGSFDPLRFFAGFRSIVREDYHIYEIFWKVGLLPLLSDKLRGLLLESVFEQYFAYARLDAQDPKVQNRYYLYAEYMSAGLLAMVGEWIMDPQMSLEEFTRFTARIVMNGLSTVEGSKQEVPARPGSAGGSRPDP